MLRFGSDKPDMRFGMEIQDATEVTRGSEFGVFKNAPCVRYLVVPKTFSRSEHERLEGFAKEWGAKGLAMLSQISKFLSEAELAAFGVAEGETAFFVADEQETVEKVLGLLRLELANELDLDPRDRRLPLGRRLPALQARRGDGRVDVHASPVHGAGSRARRRGTSRTRSACAASITTSSGTAGSSAPARSGSTTSTMQQAVFRTMGLGEEEQRDKFGFLLEALAMGAPPHGGFAMGIDRFVARLAGEPDIRQMNAFPKVSSGSDPLTGAPTAYTDAALKELGIRLVEPPA